MKASPDGSWVACEAFFVNLEDGAPHPVRPGLPKRRRNPRRAYDEHGQEFTPATSGHMRDRDRITTVTAYCDTIQCGHSARVDVTSWPAETFVPDIGLRLRCSRCRRVNSARIMPDWVSK